MGFFGWTVYGGGFHPGYVNQFCSDWAEIFTGYVKPCENNKSGKNFEKTKISRKFRENTLILRNIRRLFKLALEIASVTQYLQFCIKMMSDD